VDLNRLCQTAAADATVGSPGREVRLTLDPAVPPVTTDGERLHGVLVNVLTNARHALEARGTTGPPPGPPGEADLELATQRSANGRVLVVVRDRGVGIPAENLARVWEPYFTTRRGGTGLGLAIVRNVIEGLGGTIAIESQPAGGTSVRIELPEVPPAATAASAARERTA
jgi:two-component system nitrogen regulation sensor histidine kinase NtrY